MSVTDPFSPSSTYLTLLGGGSSTLTIYFNPTTYETFAQDLQLVTDSADVGTVSIPLTGATITDEDGDGYDTTEASGGTDCDDDDADVHPGAEEQWYDGVDEDCAGDNDFDRDIDGYDAETDDHTVADGMADCVDTDAEFHPGAEDVPYDNRDTNCDDENDYDYDGDGYESEEYGRGSDCNDYDATVNRDATEFFDGQDSDCDGGVDNDSEAMASLYLYNAQDSLDRTGYATAAGDLDGDGDAEVIVGAPYVDATAPSSTSARGGVAVFEGGDLLPTGTQIDRSDNWFDGDNATDLLGNYVTVMGDFDGDGENDLAVGSMGYSTSSTSTSNNAGAVYVLSGYDALHGGDTRDAIAAYTGSSSNYFGRGIGTSIDLDSDGMDELVVAYASGTSNYVAVEYGSSSPTDKSVTSMDVQWTTDGTEVAFYRNAPIGGDLDGDGYEDLVLSDGKADYGGYTDNGAMWVVWGQGTEYTNTTATDIEGTATVVVRGESSSEYDAWSTQLGEDWDGDGDAELWIYNSDEGLYVVEGGSNMRSLIDPAASAAVTYTWNASSPDAEMIRQAGDWDGDGIADMMVFIEDESGSYGLSEMFPSSVTSGTIGELDGYIGSLTGATGDDGDNADVGYGGCPVGGDVDGDGDTDLVTGDPDWGDLNGQAYVLINQSGD